MSPIRRVSVLSTGNVQIRPQHAEADGTPLPWWLFTSRRWTEWLPINVYVIEHENGLVLFDAGQDRQSVVDPAYFPPGFAGFMYRRLARFAIGGDQTLTAGLRGLGHEPEDVAVVVLSHLHQDHIGGIRELPNARVLVSSAEWKQLDSPLAELTGFLVEHIRVPGVQWEQVSLAPSADPLIAPFTGSLDIFGDGSLILISTPGHTAGSMSMLVNRADQPPLLMVGDLTYDACRMAEGHVPGMGPQREVKRTSALVLELQRRRPGLVILAAHDPGAARALDAVSAAIR